MLPQALRSIVPAYVNQIVGLLKAISLLFYVSLLDLFGVVQNLGSTYPTDIIPLLVVATIWYLVLTSVISLVQYYVERFYVRGAGSPDEHRSARPSPDGAVSIRNATKSFGAKAVLNGIDLTCRRARSRRSSGRPDRASRRCCARSTTWNDSTRATSPWMTS